jgi:transcriptional regulator with XRE-family HTH domain
VTGPAARQIAGDVTAALRTPVEPASEQDYRRQIGKRVRLVRIGLDLSQDEVATKAGVTRNFVSAIERGAQGLDAWRLRLLADALGVAPAWLLGLTGEPAPDRLGELWSRDLTPRRRETGSSSAERRPVADSEGDRPSGRASDL